LKPYTANQNGIESHQSVYLVSIAHKEPCKSCGKTDLQTLFSLLLLFVSYARDDWCEICCRSARSEIILPAGPFLWPRLKILCDDGAVDVSSSRIASKRAMTSLCVNLFSCMSALGNLDRARHLCIYLLTSRMVYVCGSRLCYMFLTRQIWRQTMSEYISYFFSRKKKQKNLTQQNICLALQIKEDPTEEQSA
jgi:hypothetical protein